MTLNTPKSWTSLEAIANAKHWRNIEANAKTSTLHFPHEINLTERLNRFLKLTKLKLFHHCNVAFLLVVTQPTTDTRRLTDKFCAHVSTGF